MADFQVLWPPFYPQFTTSSFGAAHLIDAATDALSCVYYAEEDCTIEKILWLQSTVTATSPGTLRVGLQSVSSSGVPTGTWLGSAGGYADKSSWSTGDDGSYITTTLGTSVTLARGDVFAVVFEPLAGANWTSTQYVEVGWFSVQQFGYMTPYVILNGTRSNTFRVPNFILRSATRSYGFPYETINAQTIQSSNSPAEIGIKFSIPAGVCDTFKISGVNLYYDSAGSSSFTLALYEGTDRTALQSILIDSDQTNTSGTTSGGHLFFFDNSTLSTLTAGTTYRVMIEPGATASAGSLRYATIPTSGDMTAYTGPGGTLEWTEWSGSAYTDRGTRILPMQVIITDITEPSSGGGGLNVHPGMNGRING